MHFRDIRSRYLKDNKVGQKSQTIHVAGRDKITSGIYRHDAIELSINDLQNNVFTTRPFV